MGIKLLNLRLNGLYWLVNLFRRPLPGVVLLRLMRRWLALHEAVGRLLSGMPEPAHLREMQSILPKLNDCEHATSGLHLGCTLRRR